MAELHNRGAVLCPLSGTLQAEHQLHGEIVRENAGSGACSTCIRLTGVENSVSMGDARWRGMGQR